MDKEFNGHKPMSPTNQFCGYCNEAMFTDAVKNPCKNPRPEHFTMDDWESEMQLARELATEEYLNES